MEEEEQTDWPAQELQRAVDSKMQGPLTNRALREAATADVQRDHQQWEQRQGQSPLRAYFRLPGLEQARGQPWGKQKEQTWEARLRLEALSKSFR